MSDKNPVIATCAVAVAFAGLVSAQGGPPPIPIELRARFGFQGPLLAKVGDGIGNLQLVDRKGDGRLEAVVFDGRRARLVAIRVDGETTTQESIPTEGQVAGYTFADVDGDKVPEIAIVDTRGRLSLRNADGAARVDALPFDLGLGGRGVTLLAGDLDADGRAELIAFGDGKMRVVRDLATRPQAGAIEPVEPNVRDLHLAQLFGDASPDLVCIVPGERMNLRFRLGRNDGSFGPWRIASIDGLRAVFPTTLADGAPALATVEGENRRVALRQIVADEPQAALEWWAFGEGDASRTPAFVVGDVDNDGDDDLALFPPDRAQLWLYEWRDGTFVRQSLPTLAGITSAAIGDVDGDGKLDLLVASPEEDLVAWRSGAAPLDAFPQPLAGEDKPVAVAVAPDGGALVLVRNEKRDARLEKRAPGAAATTLADLGRLPADPSRLLAADVGDTNGLEVAFVVPGEGLRAMTIGASGASDAQRGKVAAGFTRKMDDGALSLTRHDGKTALVAVRERFVRCFRFDGDGQVQVLSQDNGPEGAAELSLACELRNGARLYLDKKSDKLLLVADGAAPRTIEVPALGFTHLVPHAESALLIGPRGVLRVPLGPGAGLRAVAVHQPPTERTLYWEGRSGDFDHDGVRDLAVVDRSLPGVQILAGGADGLTRALAVPAFEAPRGGGPDSEPRELATGDLDGDGRCDLVLIAHDRVLVYPQDR